MFVFFFWVDGTNVYVSCGSKGELQCPSYAPPLHAGRMIVEAVDVLQTHNLEHVVDARHNLHIRFVRIHHTSHIFEAVIVRERTGKIKQILVACVLGKIGVVSVSQGSPQHIATNILAPLQFAQQGDAVEELSIKVPIKNGRGVTVVQEFHVTDESERTRVYDVAQIGCRHDEERIRHLVPLRTGFCQHIKLAPGTHPKAFVDRCFREVISVLAPEDSFQAHCVLQTEDGSVKIGDKTALLGVHITGIGAELQS